MRVENVAAEIDPAGAKDKEEQRRLLSSLLKEKEKAQKLYRRYLELMAEGDETAVDLREMATDKKL